MSKKKITILALILLTVGGLSTWALQSPLMAAASNGDGNVAKIGTTEYATLAEAVTAAQEGDVVVIIKEDTYTIPNLPENITIKADEGVNVVFNCVGSGSIASVPNGATFEDVTMNFGQSAYHGFQHAGTINMKGCTLNGLFFSYGAMNFNECTFNQENQEYMMWCYAGDLTYTNCKFNGKGKFLNIFNEGNGSWKISVAGCTFNSDTKKKAALNIKETCGATLLPYEITIGEGNKVEGQFPTNSTSETLIVGGNGLWQVDDRYEDHTKSLIVVKDAEGKILYEAEKPAPVAKIGDVEYATLLEAVTAADTNDEVVIIKEDTYTIPGLPKNITIKADEGVNVVFNCVGSGSIASIPNGATFEGVTMNFGQSAYHGFQHAGTINMKGCTLNGLFFSYGAMNFNGCTFIQDSYEYMMWDYGTDLTYTDCTFKGHGKYINVYNEGNGSWKLKVSGCTFYNDGEAKKAALNIKETCGATLLGWDVTIGDGNTLVGNFPANSESETLIVGGNGLWQVDDRCSDHTKSLVVVKDAEGKILYEAEKPAPVAKIGDVEYASLAEAIAAVQEGETITMLTNVEKAAGISVPSGKNFTVDFGGFTYAMECPGAGSEGTKTIGFQLLQGSTITFKNGTINCTEENKSKTWTSTSESKGIAMIIQNYANLTLNGMTIDGTNIAHNGNPGTVRYIISNNSGYVNFTGNTNIIAPDGDYAFDACKYDPYDAPTLTWKSTGVVDGFIELSGGNLSVFGIKLTKPIKVIAKSTLGINKGNIVPSTNWSGGDALVVVKRNGDLTINGSKGKISNNGNTNIYSAVKMTEAGEDDATNAAKLTVKNITLEGEYYGIAGNGNRHNTEIVVNGGTIKGVHSGDNVGIFHPQNGKLTITNGTIEGYCSAVEMRGGSITVTGGSLTSTATEFKCDPNGSGNTTVGAALAIAQHNTKKDISVQISGGEFTGVKALNECNPQQNDPAPQVTINVSGGKFKGEVSTVDVKNFLAGGIYSQKPGAAEYLAIGKTIIDNPDEATKGKYPHAIVPLADEVQVAPNLEIAPAEGEQPLTDDEKAAAKTKVDNAITDMSENESAKLPEETKQSNTEAVDESILTTNQSVGINVEFDGVKVKVESESVSLKEFTFDVTPYVVEKVTESGVEKSVSIKKIENEDIKAPMTFRLPIPSDVTDNCARVIHHKENGEDEDMGLYPITVTENTTEKHIEISTLSFSKFEAVLKTVNIPTTLRYYAGNSTKKEGTPAEFLNAKTLQPNAIAFVGSENADWAAENVNVVVDYSVGTSGHYYECPEFVLTDLYDFYTPVDFIALSGSYARTNTLGLNSVCLPFAISTSDVNEGKIGTFSSTDMKKDEEIASSGYVYFNFVTSIEAGMPCIVDCESAADWDIDLANREIKATPIGSIALKGSYEERLIGEGFLKVCEDGVRFINTNADSRVYPFRTYLDLHSANIIPAGSATPKQLMIEWNDESTTGINSIESTKANNSIYDLTGRKVSKLVKGNVYIMNGKKIIIR